MIAIIDKWLEKLKKNIYVVIFLKNFDEWISKPILSSIA